MGVANDRRVVYRQSVSGLDLEGSALFLCGVFCVLIYACIYNPFI